MEMEEWLHTVVFQNNPDFDTINDYDLIPPHLTVECGQCRRAVNLRDIDRYYRRGVVVVLSNPTKYLFESEYLICGACVTGMCIYNRPGVYYGSRSRADRPLRYRIFERHYNISIISCASTIQKEEIKPRFEMEMCLNDMAIYNSKHNYFMTLGINKDEVSCFEVRAERPEKYDPYKVRYVTLFSLLLSHLKDLGVRV